MINNYNRDTFWKPATFLPVPKAAGVVALPSNSLLILKASHLLCAQTPIPCVPGISGAVSTQHSQPRQLGTCPRSSGGSTKACCSSLRCDHFSLGSFLSVRPDTGHYWTLKTCWPNNKYQAPSTKEIKPIMSKTRLNERK